ncbi:helix-turn-helix domain-containing protein [Maribacter sp. Asnod2-G09]|uniref:helix-turn-helix domain-containing protein n=1 Tax=Maribacter sp. Asnod2-G09 TaxID=3160577 RepID=UPI00386DC1FD
METVLNVGFGIGILMFFLLLFKKAKQQGDYFFLGWIGIMLCQVAFYQITIYQFEITGFWAISFFSLPLLGAPVLYLYILHLTGHKVSARTILFHSSIYGIYVIILYAAQQYWDTLIIAKDGYLLIQKSDTFWSRLYAVPLAISGLLYCVWDLLILKEHRTSITTLFSFQEKIDLKWLTYVVNSFLILFVITSIWIFGATQFQLFPLKNAFALVGISLSLMLIAFGFYGFKQTAVFSSIDFSQNNSPIHNSPEKLKSPYSKSGLTDDKIEVLAQQLAIFMIQEKPFMNENLNLSLLADNLNISPSHLSQVINQYYKINFYDYINQYRVEMAKTMIKSNDYDHLSILGIAFECGFKSKSSFNRYFKKNTGKTPSHFNS